jgi:hypothetical protein
MFFKSDCVGINGNSANRQNAFPVAHKYITKFDLRICCCTSYSCPYRCLSSCNVFTTSLCQDAEEQWAYAHISTACELLVSKPINYTRDSSIYTVREGNHVRDLQWTSLNGVCERQTGRGTRATSGRLRGALDRSLVHEFSLDFYTAVSFTFTLLTALKKSTYYTGSEICKGQISRDRRVSDVTKYGLVGQGSISGRGIFNFTATSTQALGLTKFMSSWYRRGILQGKNGRSVKLPLSST